MLEDRGRTDRPGGLDPGRTQEIQHLLDERTEMHRNDNLLGQWASLDAVESDATVVHFGAGVAPSTFVALPGDITVFRLLRAWQLRDKADSVLIEQLWSTGAEFARVSSMAVGSAPDEGWSLDSNLYDTHPGETMVKVASQLPPIGWSSAFLSREWCHRIVPRASGAI